MKLFTFLASLMTTCFLVVTSQAAESDKTLSGPPSMTMATGSKTGTYIAFGRDIARVAAKNNLTINVIDSNGSVDNIKRVSGQSGVDLAIIQSDVLGFLARSKNAASAAAAGKLRMVAPFYNEEVHILARKDITSIADLNGKKVVVGNEDSGSMITSVNIFSTLGITPAKMFQTDPPSGLVALLNNQVDAAVFVGGKPVKMFKNMERLQDLKDGLNANKISQVHFIPINDPRLLKEYKPATLTHADYSYITDDIPTVAVTALLITSDYSKSKNSDQCHNLATLAQSLKNSIIDLRENGHPKWKEVDLGSDIGSWTRDECSATILSSVASISNSGGSDGITKDLLNVVRGGSK